LRINKVNYNLSVHDFLSDKKLITSVQNIVHLHAGMVSVNFFHLLMATSITYCGRLSDIDETLLQLTDAK